MRTISNISKLGLVASHKRNIRNGNEYDHLWPKPSFQDPIISPGASVYTTLDLMADIVQKTLEDTAKIAPKLKGKNLVETCHNIFDFAYNHFQYQQDKDGEEQLRRPSRSWADRTKGIDCDCFSILCSSILVNLGIEHAFEICELNGKGYYQHVYVVVPIKQAQFITIDPVLDKFNTKAPGITKTHRKMVPVRYLNGLNGAPEADNTLFGFEFDNMLGCACSSFKEVEQKFNQAVKSHLQNTRRIISTNKCSLGGFYEDNALLGALDFAIAAADDEDTFLGALVHLSGLEDNLMTPQMMGIYGELMGTEFLGKAKAPGVFSKAAAAVKAVKTKVEQSKAVQQVKAKVEDTKKFAKEAGKAIVKVNPLVTAARAGLLLAMETNLFGMANQLRWAYATTDQLKKHGVSAADAAKAKEVLNKVEKLFVQTLQGKPENLRKAILSGKQAINGLSGTLGEPVTAATGTAAASGFIAQIVSWIKQAGLKIKTVSDANPELKAKLVNRIKDAAFGPKPATTVKNNTLVETPPNQVPAPDNSFPKAQEITNNLVENAPMQDNTALPADLPLVADDSTKTPDPLPTDNSNNSSGSGKGSGTLVMLGLGLLAVVALASSSSSKPKALAGPSATKRKATKRKTGKKSQSKKTVLKLK